MRQSSDPTDWFFVPLPKNHWSSLSRPLVFINPKSENGEWDQEAFSDLHNTVYTPLAATFGAADEPYECHIEVSSGTAEDLHNELIALGMERRNTKDYF
jgi:hypothetical protein